MNCSDCKADSFCFRDEKFGHMQIVQISQFQTILFVLLQHYLVSDSKEFID